MPPLTKLLITVKSPGECRNKRNQIRLTPALTEIHTTSQAPPIFSPQSPAELQRARIHHTDARRCMRGTGKKKKKSNFSTTMSAASTLRLQHHHCHRLESQSGAPNKPHTLVPQAPVLQSALSVSLALSLVSVVSAPCSSPVSEFSVFSSSTSQFTGTAAVAVADALCSSPLSQGQFT